MMSKRFEMAGQRLRNQRVTGAGLEKPGDVVGWLVAVQAQDYAGAKWSLGLRMQNALDSDIDRAFDEGTILRTHLMRPTWHFVTPADIGWLLALTAPRVHAVNAHMYRKLDLDAAVFTQSNAALVKALHGGNQLTRDELQDVLRRAGIVADNRLRLAYIMMQAELAGVICSGSRRGKQFTYALLSERAPHTKTLEREEALAELARRYFVSRGPATVQDLAKWSGLTIADARHGLEFVQEQLQQETVGGQVYWLPTSTPTVNQELPNIHLLSIYDEYISSYKDHSAMCAADIGIRLTALGSALSYIIVVDGQIVGVWKRTLRKDVIVIEVDFFTQLTKADNQAVVAAAQRYGQFLNRSVVWA